MNPSILYVCRAAVFIILAMSAISMASGDVNSLAISPDGSQLAVAGDALTVLDGGALQERWRPTESTGQVRGVAFSPDGKVLAVACRNGMVHTWNAADGAPIASFKGHKKSANSVSFSPDGTRLATGSSDKTVRIWDAGTHQEVRSLGAGSTAVHAVAFSPDGALVAGASADGTARIWNVVSGDCVATLFGHTSSIWSVAFDPSGQYVATGSRDTTVKVWDAATGVCLRTFSGHNSVVRAVAFSPDGVHLASGSWDRSIRVWHLQSGKIEAMFRGHSQPVRALTFSPDGKKLYSGSAYEEQGIRVWEKDLPLSETPLQTKLEPLPEPMLDVAEREPVVIAPGTEKAWPDGTHGAETSAAIQSALGVAMGTLGSGRRVVELPPGEYLITRPLHMSDVTLCGRGAVLRVKNETDTYFFGLRLGSGARVHDIKIIGEGDRCIPVHLANPARDVLLRDVHIQGGTILLNGQVTCENLEIDSCLFEDGGYGLLLDRPSKGRNVRVTNCTFKNNRSDSIELNFPWHGKGNFVEDIVIANCVFEGAGPDPDSGTAGFAIGMAGARNVQITGNSFRNSAVQAIHIEDDSENITITGNNMINCGLDHTSGNWTGGVHILSGSRYITISGNNINNCRFGVSGLQGGTLRWCTITGNTFRNCEIGVRVMQFPHGVIQGNLFHDCQTSINIWRTPFWTVTGNQIASTRSGAVGVKSTQFLKLLLVNNTIQAETPIEHRESHVNQDSLTEPNLVIP